MIYQACGLDKHKGAFALQKLLCVGADEGTCEPVFARFIWMYNFFPARAQIIAVASNSKGFGVLIIHINTKWNDLRSFHFVLVRMKGLEPIWSCPH